MERLICGAKVPDFYATCHNGEAFHLADHFGQLIWLIFYRYPGCPLCNLHISSILNRKDWLKKNSVQVIAVFDSAAANFPKRVEGRKYPDFPLIADPNNELYDLYGTESRLSAVLKPSVAACFVKALFAGEKQGKVTGDLGQIPAHFLIAEDGILERMHYGTSIADHISWTTVEHFVSERRTGVWDPTVLV